MKHYEEAKAAPPSDDSEVQPYTDVFDWTSVSNEEKSTLERIGMASIAAGEVAAVIMSGGQGTRLGFDGPKGMYDIGLPSHKSIFQIHIERIAKVRQLASHAMKTALPRVAVYIMTSDLNDADIKTYFTTHDYFGYPSEDIYFFQQGLEPCLTLDGKLIVNSPDSVALAPDGNGGLYQALLTTGAYQDMQARNIHHLHIYGIDNILTKSLDPAFIGLCISQSAECGNKVVWRRNSAERVGVTATRKNRMCVIEYSEIPNHMSCKSDSNGKLIYGAANICNHYVSVSFLKEKVFPQLYSVYHIAKKKIPYFDMATKQVIQPMAENGVKLEMFIFDVFPLADRFAVMQVCREDEFAPVKNASGSESDSPEIARALISNQATRWLRAAGVRVENENACVEVSPLVSYAGEGLNQYEGSIFTGPCYLAGHY